MIHSLKLTFSHLKMDDWKTFSFPFGAFRPIFREGVSLVMLSSRLPICLHVFCCIRSSLGDFFGMFPTNRGVFPPKWMVNIMVPNPIKMDDLGGPPLFLETPISKVTAKNPHRKHKNQSKQKIQVSFSLDFRCHDGCTKR